MEESLNKIWKRDWKSKGISFKQFVNDINSQDEPAVEEAEIVNDIEQQPMFKNFSGDALNPNGSNTLSATGDEDADLETINVPSSSANINTIPANANSNKTSYALYIGLGVAAGFLITMIVMKGKGKKIEVTV